MTTMDTSLITITNSQTSTCSPQKKDISRFVKFFLIKCSEIVIQSRTSSTRVRSECRLPQQQNNSQQQQQGDWFNLQIPPTPATPQIHSSLHPHLTQDRTNYSITIATHLTTEDVVLPLEIWRFHVDTGMLQAPRDVYNVYNRLGLMVKSVICVSRATPGFKIARKTGPDVSIGYEIRSDLVDDDFEEEKIGVLLGDGYKRVALGRVPLTTPTTTTTQQPIQSPTTTLATTIPITTTPTTDITTTTTTEQQSTASITTTIFYRTKMELLITSQQQKNNKKNSQMLIKSDHYGNDDQNIVKNSVRPAFGNSDLVIKLEDEEEDDEEDGDFFKLVAKRLSPTTTPTDECNKNNNNNTEQPHPLHDHTHPPKETLKELTLPFFNTTTTPTTSSYPHQKDSTHSSNTSESELLNLFEEFRVAPVTLKCFNNNEQQQQELPGDGVLKQFEDEMEFYSEFFDGRLGGGGGGDSVPMEMSGCGGGGDSM